MKKVTKKFNQFFICVSLILLFIGISDNSIAQQVIGLSFGYEFFPHVKLVDPITGSEDFEIKASSWSIGAAFPLSFAKGKIMVLKIWHMCKKI